MNALVWTGVCILAGISEFPGGECVPSALHNNHYVYDIDMDLENHLPGAHHRRPRRTGRGTSIDTWACDTITTVPDHIRTDFPLNVFYQKYTHAYGIPIVSSNVSRNAALTRACYTVRLLLADRKDIRDAMYDQYGRVGVIAQTEQTNDIPEHSYLGDAWNYRARGLGGLPRRPITTDGEENILCLPFYRDRWHEEDVLIHEFAHSIHLISLNRIDASFQPALIEIYNQAKVNNLWRSTYAISNYREYFAEGVQGFFNDQTCRDFVDNVHNDICTRDALKNYDRPLYDLIVAVFPCMNTAVSRCDSDQEKAANQTLRMNCEVPETTTSPNTDSATDTVTGSVTDTVTGSATDTFTGSATDIVTSSATDTVTGVVTYTVTGSATDEIVDLTPDIVTDSVSSTVTMAKLTQKTGAGGTTVRAKIKMTNGANCTHDGWHQTLAWMLLVISCMVMNSR